MEQTPHPAAPSQDSLPAPIEMLRARFLDEAVRTSLRGFSKTLQISLTDLLADYVFTVKNGELIDVEKRTIPNADITVTVSSSLMEGILTKKSNGILAYMTGKLKMKGTMDDLMRLQKLMG